jgi:lipopolysaccharide export LptBFGC system permease protein LptF
MGVLFLYYLLLVMGLNVAEKGKWPAAPALWVGNVAALAVGAELFRRRLAR